MKLQGEDGMLCGDMLFSGHTLVMMVCLLTVTHYLPAKWRVSISKRRLSKNRQRE